MKTKFYSIGIILSLCLLISCNKKQSVKGVISNADGKLLSLTRNIIIDSVTLKEKGNFTFKYEQNSKLPVFLTLQTNDKAIANLLVEKGEKVFIEADYNNLKDYKVTGSEGSELMRELNQKMIEASLRLDSLEQVIRDSGGTLDLQRKKVRIITKHKQDLIKFTLINANSLSAFMALYQIMPNGMKMFGVESDALLYKMVADSLEKKYSKSQYVEQLRGDHTRLSNIRGMRDLLENAKEIDLPTIKLNDANNNEVSLDNLKGKTVLLNFWASWDKGSTMDNIELIDIYNKYKDKNFEIYNISLDDNKEAWIKTITTQNLPWINVFAGRNSYIARLYNVLKLPTTYLISKEGEILIRDIEIKDLDKKLSTILK